MKTHKKLGHKMKSADVLHNTFGNKNTGIEGSESTKINSFSIIAKLSKFGLSAKLDNIKAHNETGRNIKPEEIYALFLEKRIQSVNLGNWNSCVELLIGFMWKNVLSYGGERTFMLTLSAVTLTTKNLRNIT
jgi:hypothetical protein